MLLMKKMIRSGREDVMQTNENEKKYNLLLHRLAAAVGGFAAAYTLVLRAGLGSSQTVNIMDALFGLLGKDLRTSLLHLFGMLIYGASVFGITVLKKKSRMDLPIFSMCLNIAGFALLAALPADIDPIVGLYPTFITMSVMWVVFADMGGYASSPIFCTNNFRQMCGALAEYTCDKSEASLKKAKFFAGTLAVFFLGAAAGYYLTQFLAVKAAFVGAVPCLIAIAAELAKLHYLHKAAHDFHKISPKLV